MRGVDLIKQFWSTLPEKPGIYKMLDDQGNILYIGKAKSLRKRVVYYTKTADLTNRLARMVFLTSSAEYIVTSSEAEAFILEAAQIKQYQPRFNILLKDDKSFPFIKINFAHDFPQISKYRGKKLDKDKYFGPFANSLDVDRTINIIKKIFKIRGCTDNYFANRKRPCLQYQIKRCSAPCVGKISREDYESSIDCTLKFLKGQSKALHEELSCKMQEFSEALEFEKAAEIRDGIKALSYIQINTNGLGAVEDSDVIGIAHENHIYCIQIFFYRAGQNFGSNIYFPKHSEDASIEEVFGSFVGQFYQSKIPAPSIISNVSIESQESVEEALKKLHGIKCKFIIPKKSGDTKKLLDHVMLNVNESLKREVASRMKNVGILESIKELFELPEVPTRIEFYDNSHIMGQYAVGSMVVAGSEGLMKNEYRKYTIKSNLSNSGGDDYGMMKEVLGRRIKRFVTDPEKIPSLIILDGGKGHLSAALKVLAEEGVDIPIACMSKGEKRDAGGEYFHMKNRVAFTLSNNQSQMKYLQILRDEAHNFAITAHRSKRTKAVYQSKVDNIPGIGAVRKKSLLSYFGSFDAIQNASELDLQKAVGISKEIAKNIKNYFDQNYTS